LLKVHGEWITPDKFSVEIIELNGKPYNGDGWTVKSAQLDHTDPCVGYRIEEIKNTVTKSVVYSGDTDYCRGIVELSKNADLFISECSFPEKYKIKGHLTPRLAGKIAKESGCKYLVLTHLYPVCDKYNIRAECRKVYKGKLTIAKDLMKFEV
jgi:ribonuclease BN (tRNA processing enzyme)